MAKQRISQKEFFAILRENAGLYARTARAIQKQFGISYTRQSVKERAERRPDILEDIREENVDVAEEGLHSLMRSKDERIKLKAVEIYLRTIGKKRGYVEQVDTREVDNPWLALAKQSVSGGE